MKWLLSALAFAAVGCVALMNASSLWVAVVFNSTMLSLFCASLIAFASNGKKRAAAAGFAIGGWCYIATMLLAQHADNTMLLEQHADNQSWNKLPTHHVLRLAHRKVSRQVPWTPPPSLSLVPNSGFTVDDPPQSLFYTIGHYLWALLFGFCGAVVTSAIHRKSTKAEAVDGNCSNKGY